MLCYVRNLSPTAINLKVPTKGENFELLSFAQKFEKK